MHPKITSSKVYTIQYTYMCVCVCLHAFHVQAGVSSMSSHIFVLKCFMAYTTHTHTHLNFGSQLYLSFQAFFSYNIQHTCFPSQCCIVRGRVVCLCVYSVYTWYMTSWYQVQRTRTHTHTHSVHTLCHVLFNYHIRSEYYFAIQQ